MTAQKEQYLIETYPKVFPSKDIRGNPMKSCLAWGFECGDGWFGLIERCIKALHELPDPPKLAQVKEKFGTLRVYIDGGSDEAYGIIQKAEAESEITCEECGKEGKLYSTGWWSVKCDDCRKRQEEPSG